MNKHLKIFKINNINDISYDELKRRYRILIMKYHPDHGGNRIQFESIQEAYNYLKDKVAGIEKEIVYKKINVYA
jgi:DnaJ-class molecular chaperone